MARTLRFDENTRIAVAEPTDIQDLHLADLSWVLEVTEEDGAVTECIVDLDELLKAVTVYSAQDKFRYGWRRRWRDERDAEGDGSDAVERTEGDATE